MIVYENENIILINNLSDTKKYNLLHSFTVIAILVAVLVEVKMYWRQVANEKRDTSERQNRDTIDT